MTASDHTVLTTQSIVIPGLKARDKSEAIRLLSTSLLEDGRVTNLEGFIEDVEERESQINTGLPGGIAIPHARSGHVTCASVAVGLSPEGVDFGASDGKADLIFLIAAPDGADDEHLHILAALARKLVHDDFRDKLRSAKSAAKIADIITKEVQR